MRLTNVRIVAGAGILALAMAAACLAGAAGPVQARPAAQARPVQARVQAETQAQPARGGDLYFVSGEYIMRLPLAGGKPQRVVKVGAVSVTGIAISGQRLFWVTQVGEGGSLNYVALKGAPVAHTLVWNLSVPVGLVAADGWLYWADQNAIGRVRPDGAQLTRRFVVPPQEYGGGIAEGLATDGQHLFFSRCQDNEIGRVDASGHGLDLSFIKLPAKSCPEGLTVGNDHVYWTELASHVGRATLQGTGASITWLNIRNNEGPFYLAADDSNVYWDWGGVAGSPMHVGTARVNGTGLRTSILLGQGAFLLTSPGANS
jgi:hypothetical protein